MKITMTNINKLAIIVLSGLFFLLGAISFCIAEEPAIITETEGDEPNEMLRMIPHLKIASTSVSALMKELQNGKTTGFKLSLVLEFNDKAYEYIGLSKENAEKIKEEMESKAISITEELINVEDMEKKLNSGSLEDSELILNALEEMYPKLFDAIDEIALENLSPEQVQKLQEYTLFSMDDDTLLPGFIDFDALHAVIDPSEVQSELIAEMKEKYFGEVGEIFRKIDEFCTEIENETIEEEKIKEKFSELEEIFDGEIFLELKKKYKERIESILTKEQKEKLAEIEKRVPKKSSETTTENDSEEEKDESWKESWQPGDPIPEDQKKERRPSIFPVI